MATTNILEFNVQKSNMMSDSSYSSSSQRNSGVTSGLADSSLHNKLFRQTSLMAAALAKAVQQSGYDVLDTSTAESIATNILSLLKFSLNDSTTLQSYTFSIENGILYLVNSSTKQKIQIGYYQQIVSSVSSHNSSQTAHQTLFNSNLTSAKNYTDSKIIASTADLIPEVSGLATGKVYLVYE